jgi:hypothetical protein
MDSAEILSLARAFERLLICLAGFAALGMGWNLFRVGVVDPQSAELKAKSWVVKLQRCGPGVFFALFGTAILMWSVNSTLTIPTGSGLSDTGTTDATKKGRRQTEPTAIKYGAGGVSNRKELAQSINTISATLQRVAPGVPSARDSLQPVQLQKLDVALRHLQEVRDALAIDEFGLDTVNWYKANETRFLTTESRYGRAEAEKMRAVMAWMSDEVPAK